jgi:hypothetical protein
MKASCSPKSHLRPLLLVLLLCCVSCGPSSHRHPAIEFTHLPPANPGGPDLLDFIEGRVEDAAPGQQVVLYAHAGAWWIQPTTDQPFTKIQPDATWKNSTHLGLEYAALLVDPGYLPGAKLEALPPVGKGVAAVAIGKGPAGVPASEKLIRFSGYDWVVRAAGSNRGGEPSAFSTKNAWTDSKGYLHLRMGIEDGRWTNAEVNLNRSLGYGSYRFVVEDSAHLPPSAVVGLFTMDEVRTSIVENELDVELSQWSKPKSRNSQYLVQPYYVPENVSRFSTPGGVVTHSFRWEPGKVSFASVRGAEIRPDSRPFAQHVFTSGIPAAGGQTAHINLYDFHHSQSHLQGPVEVVIEKFEYLP